MQLAAEAYGHNEQMVEQFVGGWLEDIK